MTLQLVHSAPLERVSWPEWHVDTNGCNGDLIVVDDDSTVRCALAMMFAQAGFRVTTFTDGSSFLTHSRTDDATCILLDVYMPSPTGFSLARDLRRLYPPSRMMLVMMSGLELDEETLLGAGQAGFDHCIGKLVSPQELDQLLSTAPAGDGARPAE